MKNKFQIEESTKHICSGMLGESDKLSGWRGKSEPKVVMLKWAQKTITELDRSIKLKNEF